MVSVALDLMSNFTCRFSRAAEATVLTNVRIPMADPRHPEREQLLEWLGRPYNPEAFNQVALNKLLKGLKV